MLYLQSNLKDRIFPKLLEESNRNNNSKTWKGCHTSHIIQTDKPPSENAESIWKTTTEEAIANPSRQLGQRKVPDCSRNEQYSQRQHLIRFDTQVSLRKWLLIKRRFLVKYRDILSDQHKIRARVPHGSILGPLLDLIYTVDSPASGSTITATFADDTTTLSSHVDLKLAPLQLEWHLREEENWLQMWSVKVNESKGVKVTFTLRKGNCAQVKINTIAILQSEKEYRDEKSTI